MASVNKRLKPTTKRERYAVLLRRLFGVRKEKPVPNIKPRSIVILGLERFGDSILTTPLIRNLKKNYPSTNIYIVTPGRRAFTFFSADKNITRIFNVKKNFFSTIWFFWKNPADILFNPKDNLSFTFILLSRIIRSKYSVGLNFPFHKEHYNAVIDVAPSEHIIYKNCALLDILNIEYSDDDLTPYIPEGKISGDLMQFAESLEYEEIVALNISAGSPVREQAKENWMKIVEKIPYKVIVFSMPDRYEDKMWLEKSPNVIPTPLLQSFAESEYVLKKCALLISPDTAMIHLASAAKIPTIGLFLTHYDADRFAPFGVSYKILFGKHTLGDIDADEIIRESIAVIEKPNSSQ